MRSQNPIQIPDQDRRSNEITSATSDENGLFPPELKPGTWQPTSGLWHPLSGIVTTCHSSFLPKKVRRSIPIPVHTIHSFIHSFIQERVVKTSKSKMSVENLPSGRERAIETLIDMEPQGSIYRAARVLEESVPQALLHRPNLVTKAALVEQAYALAKYEIDQLVKYDDVFGERQNASFSDRLVSVGDIRKERILRHHAKILAAKRGNKAKQASGGVAPSPQLVAALRHVYGETESLELWSLLQSVMDHSAFSKGDSSAKNKVVTDTITVATEEIRNYSGAYQLESLISNLSKNEEGAAKLHGLLITVLSVVTSYEVKDTIKSGETSAEQPDPSSPPPLQVGSILSVVRPEEDDKNPWSLDTELLSYLGEVAALYEERIEIQKERLLSKLDDSTREQPDPTTPGADGEPTPKTPVVVGDDAISSPPVIDTPVASTPQPASTPDVVAVREDLSNVQDDIEAAAAALSTAIFEQIISSATGVESSDDGDSSDSGSDRDSDYDESGQRGLDNGSSSSSSSSSSELGTGEDGQQANPHVESEDDDEEEEADEGGDTDDDMVLRQALALSLVDQSQSLRVDTASSELDAMISPILTPGPVTPGTETPISTKDSSDTPQPNEDSPLPSIPSPPKVYPYSHLLDTMIDSDQVETESPYFNPAALHRFGALPAPHVLMHLLRFTLETIERRKFQGREESTANPRNDALRSTIAGGMGSSLFPPNHQFLKSQRPSQDTGNEIAVSLQMLVSLFLLINDRRNDAMDKFKIAVAQESRAVEVEGDESKRDKHGSTPIEGDDPAIAMALHYLDEEAESKESLQAKGMRRKAAAAAHDAAALLKSLRRRTASWKHQVELFSHCTHLSMKCLHTFFQYVVRRWMQERQSVSSTGCHDLLPKTVILKLSAALDSFIMSSVKGSDPNVGRAADDTDEAFLSLRMYQCAVLLWGEAVPIMHPTVSSQTEVLRSLLVECSNSTKAASYRSFEKLASLPSSVSEPNFHKLHVLCRRLRVSDLLDCFVSSPACYLPEETGETSDGNLNADPNNGPHRSSSLVSLIGSLSKELGGLSGELQSLYLAICHKCHVRILLWDGLYACSDSEAEDSALLLASSPSDSVRVGTNPADSLVFDATKCSDSMAIVPNQSEGGTNGSAVNQRASKVWGTVLSSSSFSPKTGIHRWAVRLDKCERGHVFIGVSTTQASTRTYVGGDKYGWGMIGTQALWHDRRKIRGDYGATFRTGSTIVVTLDTDAGTLSFSLWKDSAPSNSFSLEPVVQNVGSPRRHGHVGGTVEDWGIAFEGLPLDSRLFPAVGLYQRDDRVTLLTVESGQVAVHRESAIDLSGGLCYYPRAIDDSEESTIAQLSSVQKFNDLLSWDGIEYAARTLKDIVRGFHEGIDEKLYSTLLPCLASALCLIPPTIPVLSQRCALALLPSLSECVLGLEKLQSGIANQKVFPNGLYEGKWVIRATGSSGASSDSEEYLVDITSTVDDDGSIIGFEGSGVGTTGKSKNGLVAIFGSVKGSFIHFVEEWSDGNDEGFSRLTSDETSSSCVISARLSLDGKKFEGHYRNVQFGTTGQIAGLLQADDRKVSKFRLKEAPVPTKDSVSLADAIASGKALLCLAHSHLTSMLAEDASADFSYPLPPPRDMDHTDLSWKSHFSQLTSCLALSILSHSSTASEEVSLLAHMESIRDLYAAPIQLSTESSGGYHSLVSEAFLRRYILTQEDELAYVSFDERIKDAVAEADGRVCALVGGVGSLAVLSQAEYNEARKSLICAFVHHCGIGSASLSLESDVPAEVKEMWSGAHMILESGVRSAIAAKGGDSSARDKARELCLLYHAFASFLLSLKTRQKDAMSVEAVIADVLDMFRNVKSKKDIEVLIEEMGRSTKRGILRAISMHEAVCLMKEYSHNECPSVVESLATGFPRMLGRGLTSLFAAQERQSEMSEGTQLGAHYLSNLPGVSGIVRSALQGKLHALWTVLVETFELSASQGNATDSRDPIMADSMTLALIASFTAVVQQDDVEFVIRRTRLLPMMTSIFESHRDRAMSYSSTTEELSLGDSIVKELYSIGRREVSRSVVRSLMGLSHVLTYQSLAAHNDVSFQHDGLSMCLDVVLHELKKTTPLVQKAFVHAAASYHRRLGEGQWEKWLEESTKLETPKTPLERPKRTGIPRQAGRSGVNYLQENGISHLSLSQVTTQKPQSRNRGLQQSPSSKGGAENTSKQHNYFGHQLFTHWLHIVVAASKAPLGREIVSTTPAWIDILLSLIGLSDDKYPQLTELSSSSIPGRYRARILRTLLPFLELQPPSHAIVKGLFQLAGNASLIASRNLDEDESVVSREAVSLLRQLHSPRLTKWRSAVNDAISSILTASLGADRNLTSKLGVILFFNGGVEGINRGSFVLLKPAAATALSTEQQAAPSSKGHPGSSGGGPSVNSTPHHIVGNGTEGIVSGLCREDASAGIVSSIDSKNGLCEVILLNRDAREMTESNQAMTSKFRKKIASSISRGSSSTRHTLTVRAVRIPLSDIAHAQEVALYLDESVGVAEIFSDVLKEALAIRSKYPSHDSEASLDEEKKEVDVSSIRSDLVEASYSAMVLKAAISSLSDKRILEAFLKNVSSHDVLSDLLRLAFSEKIASSSKEKSTKVSSSSYLSGLSTHEARWIHMTSLLRGLILRAEATENYLGANSEDRFSDYKRRVEPAESSASSDTTGRGLLDGYSTPPVESGIVPEIPPALTAGTRNDGRETSGGETRNIETAARSTSQSTSTNDNSEEDEDSEAAATAASHLREAAIAQMAELGLPRSWSELALRRTGGTNIEAAVHFCLERGGEMERLLAEERERERIMQRQSSTGSSGRRRGNNRSENSSHLLRQLMEMGFPSRWCAEALAATGNNVDEALTWILTNGERLSAEDAGMEDGEDDEDIDGDDDDDDDESQEDEDSCDAVAAQATGSKTKTDDDVSDNDPKQTEGSEEIQAWKGSVIPLRFISGRSIIDSKTLSISGLPTGGFSSVGTKGILLTSGKWYYEAILETAGCLQIGWADGSFAGHCHADRGDGCGDGPSSWAFDGWRRYRWHATATEWGCRWKEGDVIGCMVDMDEKSVSFTLNGRGEEIGMGVAFSGQGFRPCGGVYACVSFNRREKLRMILGGSGSEPFKYAPPPGYLGVGQAVLTAVREREVLISKEDILDSTLSHEQESNKSMPEAAKRFLCDFSDGEHGHELMAWAHRYYGSDASVHLGSGRGKSGSVHKTAGSSSAAQETSIAQCLNRRLDKAWLQPKGSVAEDAVVESKDSLFSKVKKGYVEVASTIREQTLGECSALSSLYARKLLLHIMVIKGEDFDPDFCLSSDRSRLQSAVRFWKMIETSASLRPVGWVGEAGAMAVAAEALGLGISSNDNLSSRHPSTARPWSASLSELDEGVSIQGAGIVQVLSSILEANVEGDAIATSCNFVASSEAAIGGDGGGGVLVFLRKGLQGAICRSEEIREVIIASLRRSIRLLAVVEYDGEDSSTTDAPEEDNVPGSPSTPGKSSASVDEDTAESTPLADARLVSFMTGLLLSPQVESAVENHDEIKAALFEAWSVGLLSASLPWRMVCAFTASGILNSCPRALSNVADSYPTLSRFYGRLLSTVARRTWAERAASPICSRYTQAMIELLCSVRRSVGSLELPDHFMKYWNSITVDAATPLPLPDQSISTEEAQVGWEAENGWVSSDTGYEIWSGIVTVLPVDWKTPSRSAVRTLMDGGDGPPMLREGCFVMRGLDWANGTSNENEDGKDIYESEKAKRDAEKQAIEAKEGEDETKSVEKSLSGVEGSEGVTAEENPDPPIAAEPEPTEETPQTEAQDAGKAKKSKKKKKSPSPKLPLGTVLSIEAWDGIPGMARRIRWHLTGEEGTYRYGGDGGRYDISHVEVNEKSTRVRKRHPLPESAEQCAARHGFGVEKRYSVLLRLKKMGTRRAVDGGKVECVRQGILEWPDFGAGILVDCTLHANGTLTVKERELVYGSKDSGWEARFGQASFVPGTVVALSPVESSTNQAEVDSMSPYKSMYEELLGSSTYDVQDLRNREDGGKLRVTSELRLLRGRGYSDGPLSPPSVLPSSLSIQSQLPPPISFDHDYHAPSLSLSKDGRTVSCVSSDGRGTAFASMGFTKGVHYWEVKLEQADIGSVFIGVAEKPTGNGSGSSYGYDSPPRLNKWHGWGFVNFRATYTAGAERIYGAHCHSGDTVGVLLDCDAGRLSFFFDGLKYGEHILNDLGCAFENLSPFGFNVDGCGSGGAGQGAPSAVEGGRSGRYPAQGAVRPKALWPVIGLRNQGDRVTMSSKWSSSYGSDGVSTVRNVLALDEAMGVYGGTIQEIRTETNQSFPDWFVAEAFSEYRRWKSGSWCRSGTRGSGPYELASCALNLDLDCSPLACASACALLGLKTALLAGDRVRLKRSAGRILELAEEAVILGAYQGRLYYRIVSQKSEGGSLTEGGGRAWCWDESEVVDGTATIGDSRGLGIDLPLMDRFRCTSQGGLKVVYEGGAVVRSDLEIFEGSMNLGSIPVNTILPRKDVLERRVNSCGVVRYRVRYENLEGWISSRIRGGKEEAIVAPVFENEEEDNDMEEVSLKTPLDCALKWYEAYNNETSSNAASQEEDGGEDIDSFTKLLAEGVISGLPMAQSDAFLSRSIGMICDLCDGGNPLDVNFDQLSSAISFALASKYGQPISEAQGSAGVNEVAATAFSTIGSSLPSAEAILARVALLRALNRRAKIALPWMSLRPSQEGSALFGGTYGHGASIERAGRSSNQALLSQWVQVPTIASKIRALRGLFFTSVKKDFLRGITDATTTPTPLSHDEYELPREIRTVRLNRLKARRVMASEDVGYKKKHSVFAQLHNETKNWGGAALRRGFVAKGHGGQKRAFKVKLIGEGVNDYSGPYREAFTDSLAEVLNVDARGSGSLGVLDTTPNGVAQIGENRGIFMFSLNACELSKIYKSRPPFAQEERDLRDSFSSVIVARDEASREVEEALVFLGRITGTAFRHGIPLDLPLPMESVWKALVEEPSDWGARLQELDVLAHRHGASGEGPSALVLWQQRMLNAFVEGLSNVLPVEVLSLLSGEELRDSICGNPDVDVDLLRRVVEYEGYEESDEVIQFFWDTLRELTNDERKTFLQFVWARNRLPMKESDFEAPFKIMKDSAKKNGDEALPSASTCFFSLTLPEYSSKKLLKEKLLFAINNVTTMETDFQTNSAEIAEGYRAF